MFRLLLGTCQSENFLILTNFVPNSSLKQFTSLTSPLLSLSLFLLLVNIDVSQHVGTWNQDSLMVLRNLLHKKKWIVCMDFGGLQIIKKSLMLVCFQKLHFLPSQMKVSIISWINEFKKMSFRSGRKTYPPFPHFAP